MQLLSWHFFLSKVKNQYDHEANPNKYKDTTKTDTRTEAKKPKTTKTKNICDDDKDKANKDIYDNSAKEYKDIRSNGVKGKRGKC